MNNRLAESGLFMTDETKNTYAPHIIEGIIQGMPEGKHIILTGPADLSNGDASPSLKTLFNQAGYVPDFYNENIIGQIIDPTAAAAFTSFNNITEERWERQKTEHGIVSDISINEIRSSIEHMYKDNACVIVIPSLYDQSPDGYDITSPTGMMESMLEAVPGRLNGENIPGSRQELQLWVAHHESDHCQNSGDIYHEYLSDSHANNQYAQDLRERRAFDPELPYAMRTKRAGASVLGLSGDDYLTNGLSPLAGEAPLNREELDLATEQINEARSRIYADIEYETYIREETLMDPNNARMNARLAYQHGKKLLEQGMFEDIPFGETTVQRFIEGAQRYGQQYYNVATKDRINTPPELSPQARGYELPTFAAKMEQNSGPLSHLEF
jgi:hypothetical protein